MTIHVKTALILLATMVLGIVLGVLISGAFLRHPMRPEREEALSELFVSRFERLIEPDEAQRDTVRAILQSYSRRFIEMHDKHHAEMAALMDSMNVDLSPILTEEQRRRVAEHTERRHRFMGPPPPFRGRRHGP